MSDMNRVNLIGRLTRDPEIRYTPAGTAIASFSLASGRTFIKDGEKKEQLSFFDVVAWSKLGEVIVQYCKKGHRLAIEGRLSQQRWTDQEGKNRSKVEITLDSFQFLNNKQDSEGNQPPRTEEDVPDHLLTGTEDSNFNFDDLTPQ